MTTDERIMAITKRAKAQEYYCREHWGMFDADDDVLFLITQLQQAHSEIPRTWQPIETAPKDGTSFWAHCVSGFGRAHFNQEVARWVEAPKGYTFGGRFATDSGAIPTHWQPLPPSPTRTPTEEKESK